MRYLNWNKKKSLGFTLAEVLITLGIIGVVSAMTIPTLIHTHQKRVVETTLKADYSILQQVVRSCIAAGIPIDPNIPDTMDGTKSWYKTYLANYLKIERVCFEESGCWHKNKTKDLNGYKTFRAQDDGIGIGDDIITIKLANGSNICIDGWTPYWLNKIFGINLETTGIVAYVDANGDKGPNVIGKDIYIFVFTGDGFETAGSDVTTEEVRKNCNPKARSYAGYYCSTLVKNNGWVIPDDLWKSK